MCEKHLKKSRTYYRVSIEFVSALSIGAADSVQTDSDLVLDSRGLPYIPATSLCGALRSKLEKKEAKWLFGDLSVGEGIVRVYDAALESGSDHFVSLRDNVSLKNRVAVPGLKFDREVVNKGAHFVAVIELLSQEDGAADTLEGLLSRLSSGEIRLGAKKTRGLGQVRIAECLKREFDLTSLAEMNTWLDFDPFSDNGWNGEGVNRVTLAKTSAQDMATITLSLEQVGDISVREYSTEPEAYDYSQMVLPGQYVEDRDGNRIDVPSIPGTSWAGAIRERYASFSKSKDMTDFLFGKVGRDGVARSLITFDESVIEGGSWRTYKRNAIDRFTGGTIPRALYTQRSYYGGKTTLTIGINLTYKICEDGEDIDAGEQKEMADTRKIEAEYLEPLVAVLADLHNGFVSVGGLASVGHGLFRIAKAMLQVNGADLSKEFSKLLLKPANRSSCLIAPDAQAIAKLIVPQSGEGC